MPDPSRLDLSALSLRELQLAATAFDRVDGRSVLRAMRADPGAFFDPQIRGRDAWLAALAEGAIARGYARDRARLEALGGAWLAPADEGFPEHAPLDVLRVLGQLPARPGLAIVGARAADAYGLDVARRVAHAAVEAGLAVVSGGAYGVDIAAHRAALDHGGETVVVLGAGLDRATPTAHRADFARARERGAVVSPFACSAGASKWSFPRRNPWIAALSGGVVVAQASARSGSLQTARAALAMGRPVWVAPGPMDNPLHAGCHALLDEGAQVLHRPDAWRAAFALGAPTPSPAQVSEPAFGLALWRAAGAEAATLSELAQRAGLPVHEAAEQALLLELDGWLRASPGGRYARRTAENP